MGDDTMRYFLDCEFMEDGHTIDLLSIGITCEDGREYYGENGEADLSKANDWVKANVLPHLKGGGIRRWRIANDILHFVGADTPEFWADYGAYDWVALCQLFGPMVDLPEGWPMFCRDIQQEAARVGVTEFPMAEDEHNALNGARVCRHRFLYLTAFARSAGVAAGPQTTPADDVLVDTVSTSMATADFSATVTDQSWVDTPTGGSFTIPRPPGTRVRVIAAPTSQEDDHG